MCANVYTTKTFHHQLFEIEKFLLYFFSYCFFKNIFFLNSFSLCFYVFILTFIWYFILFFWFVLQLLLLFCCMNQAAIKLCTGVVKFALDDYKQPYRIIRLKCLQTLLIVKQLILWKDIKFITYKFICHNSSLYFLKDKW